MRQEKAATGNLESELKRACNIGGTLPDGWVVGPVSPDTGVSSVCGKDLTCAKVRCVRDEPGLALA